jgi:hypothetical protein
MLWQSAAALPYFHKLLRRGRRGSISPMKMFMQEHARHHAWCHHFARHACVLGNQISL